MDLEQRVAMLEQELQILKNQIQATLLDIQEHLLTNAYPALRAEGEFSQEPPPVKTVSASDNAPEQDGQPNAPHLTPCPESQLVRQISLEDLEPEYEAYESPTQPAPPANLREYQRRTDVDYDPPPAQYAEPDADFNPARRQYRMDSSPRNGNHHGVGPKVTPFVVDNDLLSGAAQNDVPITEADWATLEQLEEWTARRIRELGPHRTRELIKQYAADGHIPPNLRDSLLQLVVIIADEEAGQDANGDYNMVDRAPLPLNSENGASPHDDDEDDDVSHNHVLRLIARIATLDSSGSRRKKNG